MGIQSVSNNPRLGAEASSASPQSYSLYDPLNSILSSLSTDGASFHPYAAEICTGMLKLIPQKHPAARAFEDFIASVQSSSVSPLMVVSQLEAGCRILAFDLLKDRNALVARIESVTELFRGPHLFKELSFTEWRRGTEVTVYRDLKNNWEEATFCSVAKGREVLIKIPHAHHAALAHARAFKKQTFGALISEKVSPSIVEIVPLSTHKYFWEQGHVPGPTFSEIIDTYPEPIRQAALSRWHSISKALNGEVWFACWNAFPQILDIIKDVPVERDVLGKRFPDFNAENFILVGKVSNLTLEEVEKGPVVMIDW